MTDSDDPTAGDDRTDGPHDASVAATRRRDGRLAALSFGDAAIARIDSGASSTDAAHSRNAVKPRRETTR